MCGCGAHVWVWYTCWYDTHGVVCGGKVVPWSWWVRDQLGEEVCYLSLCDDCSGGAGEVSRRRGLTSTQPTVVRNIYIFFQRQLMQEFTY